MNNRIAVLLPHYNNTNGLELSLKSLLKESADFTLFIIDDGSADLELIDQLLEKYRNFFEIVLIKSESNKGITAALNKGLLHIKNLKVYAYIARFDAGDVCLNNRLYTQKEALDKDKKLGMVASWVRFVDMDRNKLFDFKPPIRHDKLKKVIHLYNPFVHPSVMLRVEVIEKLGLYTYNYPALEDHAYFFRVIKNFKVAILPKFLLEYEINPNGISSKFRRAQTKSRIKLLFNEYKFNIVATIGLLRAIFTYLLPQNFLIFLKKNFYIS